MNPLIQTDLEAYLHRLVKEHLSPGDNSQKRKSQEKAESSGQQEGSNSTAFDSRCPPPDAERSTT